MQWQHKQSYFWQQAPFFRLLLPFIAGIIGYNAAWAHGTFLLFSTAFATILLLVTALVRKRNAFLNTVFFALMHLTVAGLAFSVCYYNDIRNNAAWFGHTDFKASPASIVRVLDAPLEKEHTWKLHVSVIGTLNNDKTTAATGEAFTYAYKDKQPFNLKAGDTIILPASWQPIRNAGNPFEFDFAAYCARNNIYFQQFLPVSTILLYGKGTAADEGWIQSGHNWCTRQLARYITNKPALGLLQAILIGDEVNLDPDLRQSYSETGIIHIVAISGSHIAMFFTFITTLLFWIKHKRHQWIKYCIAVPLAWIYVLMSGAPPSAMRAVIMFTILAFGFILQRDRQPLNQLFGAAFILLCAQPMWLFAAGFQLSFLAVLSMILFYRPLLRWWPQTNRITRWLWSAVAASLSAELLVAPLVIYYFHLFPVAFLLANILAVLFSGVVMLLGMLIVITSFAPPVATAIAWITVRFITSFHVIITWMQGLNPVSFRFLNLTAPALAMLYATITAFALYALKKTKYGLPGGLITACLFFVLLCNAEWQREHQHILIVYNNGSTPYAEVISGSHFTPLYNDSTTDSNQPYTIKAAHTGYQAFVQSSAQGSQTLLIGHKRVLLADTANSWQYHTGSFPVDVLVLQHRFWPSAVTTLKSVFQPKEIVCGNGIKGKTLAAIRDSCAAWHVQFYPVSASGAYVLEE